MLKVKEVRLSKKVTKYELCKRTGIYFDTLSKIENGGDVKLSTLKKIADALGVDIKDLFE